MRIIQQVNDIIPLAIVDILAEEDLIGEKNIKTIGNYSEIKDKNCHSNIQ